MFQPEYVRKSTPLSNDSLPVCITMCLYIFMICAVSRVTAQNPTPDELKANWAALSDNKYGKVVYMTRSSDEIVVIDLSTGQLKKIADYPVANTSFGISGSVKWSPDGKRITMQNDKTVKVMNADGSGMKTIANAELEGDLIVNSWSGNNKVVYSVGQKIMRSEIAEDNSEASTETLVNTPPDGWWYCSVTMSGDYLAYIDAQGNLEFGGAHRPLVLKVSTGERKDMIPRTSDGCQLRIKPDGSGTVVFCEWNHYEPAIVKNWNLKEIDKISFIKDPVNNNAIQHMRWSNDTTFMTVMGAAKEPKYAWILRMSDRKSMYLGDALYHPDLWVSSETTVSHFPSEAYNDNSIKLARLSSGLLRITTDIRAKQAIKMYNPKGALLFSGASDGLTSCFIPLSKLNQGLYIITVQTAEKVFVHKTMLLGK